MKFTRFILIAFIVLNSCSPPRDLVYRSFSNLSIQSLGFNQTTITLDLEYYNPNNFGLQLKNSDLDVFINGNLLGHSSSDTLIRIPKRAEFILPVKFDIEMRQAFRNVLNVMTGKEVTIKLTGRIKAGKGNFFMILPVNYESKQTFSLFR